MSDQEDYSGEIELEDAGLLQPRKDYTTPQSYDDFKKQQNAWPKSQDLPSDHYQSITSGSSSTTSDQDYLVDKESTRQWTITTGSGIAELSKVWAGHYPMPIQGINFPTDTSQIETPKSCEHESIDVGFARSKLVCKKCNKDL